MADGGRASHPATGTAGTGPVPEPRQQQGAARPIPVPVPVPVPGLPRWPRARRCSGTGAVPADFHAGGVGAGHKGEAAAGSSHRWQLFINRARQKHVSSLHKHFICTKRKSSHFCLFNLLRKMFLNEQGEPYQSCSSCRSPEAEHCLVPRCLVVPATSIRSVPTCSGQSHIAGSSPGCCLSFPGPARPQVVHLAGTSRHAVRC